MNPVNLTNYESAVLNAIAHHEMNPQNGARPENASEVYTYCWVDDFACEAGITVPQCKGVLSSLSKKGLVEIEDWRYEDSGISFTELGFEVWAEANPEGA